MTPIPVGVGVFTPTGTATIGHMVFKVCSRCQLDKAVDEFSRNRNTLDGRQAYCKICARDYKDTWRSLSKTKAAQAASRTANWEACREVAIDHLRDNPCVDCGEADLVVLDFDHRDPTAKINTVSQMVRNGVSLDLLRREIAKCDVRCANCHRRRTAKQQNWYKAGLRYT